MNLCRFKNSQGEIRIGMTTVDRMLLDLTAGGVTRLSSILEASDPLSELKSLAAGDLPRLSLDDVELLAPVERQEVWAAGVTYLRSKTARMEESDFSASAYDRVYEADRPEIFFKSQPEKVVATGGAVGIRSDATWSVPEPELALVLNSRGKIVGYTIGNDMSSRDIEGENLLYLPQAKTYHRSCALGPWITLGPTEAAVRDWSISLEILRNGERVFSGETSVSQIKRGLDELAGFLFRCQKFPDGAVLLTGTGVVPADDFTLRENDEVVIGISGIGTLRNPVIVV
jgi:2-dehydro-3-deoxy-D-arabinonate dehydratase